MSRLEGIPGIDQTPRVEMEREPFLIRGHHLLNLADLLQVTPVELSTAMLKNLRSPFPNEVEYANDVIGFHIDDEKYFEGGITRYFTDFLNLPDEHPVVIAARPDRICESCAIGNHCKEKGTKDKYVMDHFIKVVSARGSKNEMTVAEEDTTFTGSIVRSRIITTTAQTVKSVLGEFTNFHLPPTYRY